MLKNSQTKVIVPVLTLGSAPWTLHFGESRVFRFWNSKELWSSG